MSTEQADGKTTEMYRYNETGGLSEPFCVHDDVQIDVAGLRFGSEEYIIEAECPACTYGRARLFVDYCPMRRETKVCNACGHPHGDRFNY